jgi:hypothetical protein
LKIENRLHIEERSKERLPTFGSWLSNCFISRDTKQSFSLPPPPSTQQSLVGLRVLSIEASRSYSDTRHSVGLLWTSDQPDAETSTWQHTTHPTDRHPCPRRNSNLQY